MLQVYSNTPETINLIIEVFVEVAHKQICYLGEVRPDIIMSADFSDTISFYSCKD